jgi:GNAT superfamily N-acetyltransferase
MEVQYRNAKPGDFPGIYLLFKQLWLNKELHEEDLRTVFDRGLQSKFDHYLCAEAEGKVIAFCALAVVNNFWQEGRIAYVYAMVVDEPFRGNGIGRKLLDQAYKTARVEGCKKIELDSAFHRVKAHGFYEAIGFEKRAFLFSKDLPSV